MTTHFEARVKQAIEYPPTAKSFVAINDDAQKGLLVRVYKSGHAAYYAYLYDPVAKKKTYEKVADYNALSLDKARRVVATRIERVSGKLLTTRAILPNAKKRTPCESWKLSASR